MYSDALMERFLNPSHAGDVDAANGTGAQGNITCGDVVHLSIKVRDGLITEARFRAQGCATAIASADALCELITGTSLTAAAIIDAEALSQRLDGIPTDRVNCASIVLDALRGALEEVRARRPAAGSG
ncbi:MAG TPA: iron-sulfur cluster assembly scaffold protein [Actinomycetota bacterium]|nr:iron-sulfur cluster assembly scaffold protein [Actinomycetota bacterium]